MKKTNLPVVTGQTYRGFDNVFSYIVNGLSGNQIGNINPILVYNILSNNKHSLGKDFKVYNQNVRIATAFGLLDSGYNIAVTNRDLNEQEIENSGLKCMKDEINLETKNMLTSIKKVFDRKGIILSNDFITIDTYLAAAAFFPNSMFYKTGNSPDKTLNQIYSNKILDVIEAGTAEEEIPNGIEDRCDMPTWLLLTDIENGKHNDFMSVYEIVYYTMSCQMQMTSKLLLIVLKTIDILEKENKIDEDFREMIEMFKKYNLS